MKKIILSSALLLASLCGQAQQAPEKINFNKNGEFKIAQFTDMHLGHDQEKNMIVADMIKKYLTLKSRILWFSQETLPRWTRSARHGKP